MAFSLPLFTSLGTALGASAATAGTVGAIAASTAVGAVGSIYAGGQAAAAAEGQANIATQNARTAQLQANAREDQQRRASALQLGEQRAGAAQSGFDIGVGSFAELQGQSAGNAELDALTTRYTGQLQSLSLQNEAAGLRRQASASRTQGYLNAFGTLVSGSARYGAAMQFPGLMTESAGNVAVGTRGY
jgi:hypothetical protein